MPASSLGLAPAKFEARACGSRLWMIAARHGPSAQRGAPRAELACSPFSGRVVQVPIGHKRESELHGDGRGGPDHGVDSGKIMVLAPAGGARRLS